MEINQILQEILDRNILPPIMNLFGNGWIMKSWKRRKEKEKKEKEKKRKRKERKRKRRKKEKKKRRKEGYHKKLKIVPQRHQCVFFCPIISCEIGFLGHSLLCGF